MGHVTPFLDWCPSNGWMRDTDPLPRYVMLKNVMSIAQL